MKEEYKNLIKTSLNTHIQSVLSLCSTFNAIIASVPEDLHRVAGLPTGFYFLSNLLNLEQ